MQMHITVIEIEDSDTPATAMGSLSTCFNNQSSPNEPILVLDSDEEDAKPMMIDDSDDEDDDVRLILKEEMEVDDKPVIVVEDTLDTKPTLAGDSSSQSPLHKPPSKRRLPANWKNPGVDKGKRPEKKRKISVKSEQQSQSLGKHRASSRDLDSITQIPKREADLASPTKFSTAPKTPDPAIKKLYHFEFSPDPPGFTASAGRYPETPGAGPSSAPKTPGAKRTPKAAKEPVTPKPRSKKPLSERDKVSRAAKDEKYEYRSWLYKKEVLDWHKYNLGASDLLAIPATVKENPYHEDARPTQCYRVRHLNWLQGEIDAGHGLYLPEGSAMNDQMPGFVKQNGEESLCRAMALERYHEQGLRGEQLNRLTPCKLDRVSEKKGAQQVNFWNVVDIEALLQQGANLKDGCPEVYEWSHFELIVTLEETKNVYGIGEDDLSKIEASCIETDDVTGVVIYAEYNVWDILKLKAALEANEKLDNLISMTQARKDFEVSYTQLDSIKPAARLKNAPTDDRFITYYRVSDLKKLTRQSLERHVKPGVATPQVAGPLPPGYPRLKREGVA